MSGLRLSGRLRTSIIVAVTFAVGLLAFAIGGLDHERVDASEATVVQLADSPVLPSEVVDPPRTTASLESAGGHRVIAEPECDGRTVNNSYQVSYSDGPSYDWIVQSKVLYATDDLAGPNAILSFARSRNSSFPTDGLVAHPMSFSDGSGVVEWLVDSSPFALLSVKRMDEVTLQNLADSIVAGDPSTLGFHAVPFPSEDGSVELSACMTSSGFIGIEVFRGDEPGRAMYMTGVDPTRVIEYRDGVYVEADRRTSMAPIATKVVSDEEWNDLVASSRAAGGQ